MREPTIVNEHDEDTDHRREVSGMERTPSDVERQVLALSLRSTVDEVCAVFDAVDWLMARARSIDCLRKAIGIAWIDHNGPLKLGDICFTTGYSMTVKCLDVQRTGHAVLDAANGDLDQFLSVLVSQPFKHAGVRSVIGQQVHAQLFRAHRVGRIVNGVPDRVLKRIDTRFVSDRDEHFPI